MRNKFLSALFALWILIEQLAPAAAAVTATPVFVQTPKLGAVQIVNANGTTPQSLYACGANGSKITGIFASTTDTAADTVQLSLLRSATTYIVNTVSVPAGSGTTAAAAPTPLMSFTGLPLDADGNPYFYCQSGDTI